MFYLEYRELHSLMLFISFHSSVVASVTSFLEVSFVFLLKVAMNLSQTLDSVGQTDVFPKSLMSLMTWLSVKESDKAFHCCLGVAQNALNVSHP